MKNHTTSLDGTKIYYEESGSGENTLFFVHGWIGNCRWWDKQRDFFSTNYKIVQIDLGGHGKSGQNRKKWSVESYANDIKAVAEELNLKNIILVGHSMSGSNIIEAYHLMPDRIKMLVLVDTLQDLDKMWTLNDMAPIFEGLKNAYIATIDAMFRQYMFSKSSPPIIVERVISEAKNTLAPIAIAALEPFYATEIRKSCAGVKIPVRAINGDMYPTNTPVCEKYFSNFGLKILPQSGHYPMLEMPLEFNRALEEVIL